MIVTKLYFFQRILAIGWDENQNPVLRCFKQAISGIFYNDCGDHLEIGCRKDNSSWSDSNGRMDTSPKYTCALMKN